MKYYSTCKTKQHLTCKLGRITEDFIFFLDGLSQSDLENTKNVWFAPVLYEYYII